ncbi:MAG: dTMP kinase [Acutalibacter sp.]
MSLVVLEGLDGSGKGTQAKLLAEALVCRGVPLRPVTFPDYSSPSSSLVKMYLNGEFGAEPEDVNAYAASAFYAVDRFASFRKGWGGDYRQGKLILCDRYATSNMVYQMGKLPRAEWDGYLAWVEDFEYQKLGIPRPDLVLYLDMPIEVSQKLLLQRYQGDSGKKDIHESHLAFLRSCGECARYAGKRLGWKVVPCAKGGEPLPVEEIHRAVLAAVEPLLEKP